MGFPPPSAEEIDAEKERAKICDTKIAAAKLELERLKTEANPSSLDVTEAIHEAEIEYEWAIYDKRALRRPLYPRKRAISPFNKAFRKEKQKYCSQEQSKFFNLLPPEIRAEIYRKVFGQLTIEIETTSSAFGGPHPSHDHTTFWSSKITDVDSGNQWTSRNGGKSIGYHPYIVPLLQVCRRIYAESITILYSESVFKYHRTANTIGWTKYLLNERLQIIRSVHFQVNLGYPWEAPNIHISLEEIASLKGLQKLCIVGRAGGMVDLKRTDLIDAALWNKKKHILFSLFRGFNFIKNVDIFLPIMHSILVEGNESIIEGSRLHGLTIQQRDGKKPATCACTYFPEKLET